MKTKSFLLSLLVAATAFTFFAECSGNKKEETSESHDEHAGHETAPDASAETAPIEASAPQFEVDQKFQQQIATVFTSYVNLKDAFVASDSKKIIQEASGTSEALSKVDMKLVSGAAHNDWMNYHSPIQGALKEIQSSGDIEAQRKSFSALSDNLYKSIKAFGLGGKEAFYEYCPMAFDNEGAYWLSDQEQIRNPYFGDKMLTCGSVKEKLK
jgi:hypothetical protein